MIVRGKTIGPLAVPPFTSPAARIESDDANDLCDNSLQFRRMFAFRSFFAECQLRKNICRIFSLRATSIKIQINVTDDQKLVVSRARTTLRCESNFSVWPPSRVSIFSRSQRRRITFVSHLQTCLTMAPISMVEGSKSACAGCRCLPVRLTRRNLRKKKEKNFFRKCYRPTRK